MNDDPPFLQKVWFLAAIGWLYFLALAQFRIPVAGAIGAAITGVGLVGFARTSAPTKEMAWLYGWGTEATSGIWLRWPLQSLLFFAPLVRHMTILISGERLEEKFLFAIALGVCWPVGLGIGIWLGTLRAESEGAFGPKT